MNAQAYRLCVPVRSHSAMCAHLALLDSWAYAERLAVARFGASPVTSGIGRAAFADDATRRALRELDRAATAASERSLTEWLAAGKRAHTWRRWRDVMADWWQARRAALEEVARAYVEALEDHQ